MGGGRMVNIAGAGVGRVNSRRAFVDSPAPVASGT